MNVNVDENVEWAVKKVIYIHRSCSEGDSGKEDVDGIAGIVKYMYENSEDVEGEGLQLQWLKLFPFYSQLPAEKQDCLGKREEQRKCIVSTKIAETSVTIPNIRYVVDC